MTDRFDHHDPRSPQPDPLDQVFGALDARPDPPDQTRAILGRLGYMRAVPAVTRKRRRQRLFGRALLGTAALIVAVIGVRMHEAVGVTRRPAGPTLEDALREELGRGRGMFDGAARTIRTLLVTPPARPTTDVPSGWDDVLPDDLDRSGIGPFRWL